jgi:molybdate transport system substrate-binding protein
MACSRVIACSILTIAILLPSVFGCNCADSTSDSLIILAAGGSKPAMDEVCLIYNQKHKVQVTVSYGGGGEILQQMQYGNFGDVYIAPEQSFMNTALAKSIINPETCLCVAYMIPVIAVGRNNPKNIHTLMDLTKAGISIAITRPETTLLGRLALEIFEKAGLREEIENNIVAYASDPNSLMYLITTGNVDAGIIWHFYQTYTDKLEVIFLMPEQLTGIGEMKAAVTAYSHNPTEANEFLDFLISEQGKSIFEQHGYITDAQEVTKYWKQS